MTLFLRGSAHRSDAFASGAGRIVRDPVSILLAATTLWASPFTSSNAEPLPCNAVITIDDRNTDNIDCMMQQNITINLQNGAKLSVTDSPAIRVIRPKLQLGTTPDNFSLTIKQRGEGISHIVTSLQSPYDPLSPTPTHGIHLWRLSGDIDIALDKVTTTGERADGVRIVNSDSNVSLSVSDAIVVEGVRAHGVNIDNLRKSDGAQISDAKRTLINVSDVAVTFPDTPLSESFAAVRALVVGELEIVANGKIVTQGNRIRGIAARRNNTHSGDTPPIKVTTNSIKTHGNNSPGIVVQNFDSDNFRSTIDVRGTIETQGFQSDGIYVSGPNLDSRVSIAPNAMIKANGAKAYAIYLNDSTSQSSSNDLAPLNGARIINRGIIGGDIRADTCVASLVDNEGRIEAGREIRLINRDALQKDPCMNRSGIPVANASAVPTLRNAGVLAPGGAGSIAKELEITGAYDQASSGRLEVDVDWRIGAIDRVSVTKRATLAGDLEINLLSVPLEARALTFFSADEGIGGTTDFKVADSYLVDYEIGTIADGQKRSLTVSADIDLDPDGLNENQKSVLRSIDRSYERSDEIERAYIGLLSERAVNAIRSSLDGFGNEIATAVLRQSAHAALTFGERIPNCAPMQAQAGYCVAVNGYWRSRKSGGNFSQIGHTGVTRGVAIGASVTPERLPFRFRLAVGRETRDVTMHGSATADGHGTWLATEAIVRQGSLMFRGGVSVADERHDVRRQPDRSPAASGQMKVRSRSVHTRIGYEMRHGPIDVTPSLSVIGSIIKSERYRESGAGDVSLHVSPSRHRIVQIVPAVRAMTEIGRLDDHGVSADLALSWSRLFGRAISIQSQFAAGRGHFRSRGAMPTAEAKLAIQFDFVRDDGLGAGHLAMTRARPNGQSGGTTTLGAGYRWTF